ncbi:hypothetical protein [Dyadobacter sediminis]|uniref:Uncharacterized protein n=1 Tax=Dyadobacter sediminis TaxID=1493691 RepID=A0A5R9K5M4_9BACT|nr:hypothetical protein [Dyadobacter sediminis]TLU88856.1 hypothetical protein FEM55_24480 [Dyadobacter sediminis]GGC13753.1 hypothetical protein GCM10011325_45870 [Dyadobacter sediminis]
MNKKYIFLIILAVLAGYIIYDSTSQPNVNDLKGNFKEVSSYRNANNTGPIIRIYAVTVENTPWEEMRKYGDLMPYTKYGSTKVYFFDQSKAFPEKVVPEEQNFDARYAANCVAMYSKDANGQVSFSRYPFKK